MRHKNFIILFLSVFSAILILVLQNMKEENKTDPELLPSSIGESPRKVNLDPFNIVLFLRAPQIFTRRQQQRLLTQNSRTCDFSVSEMSLAKGTSNSNQTSPSKKARLFIFPPLFLIEVLLLHLTLNSKLLIKARGPDHEVGFHGQWEKAQVLTQYWLRARFTQL